MPETNEHEIAQVDTDHTAAWEHTQAIIEGAYVQYIKEFQRIPTIRNLAKITKYSPNTIHAHVKSLSKKSLDERIQKVRVLTNAVVHKIATEAINGDVAAMKLFMQVVEKWNEKINLEHSGDTDFTIKFDKAFDGV